MTCKPGCKPGGACSWTECDRSRIEIDRRAVLRTEGEKAFALWADLGRPKLCPCCGAWNQPDGSRGPDLPHCARRIDEPADGDRTVWRHDESCARIAESDYARDLCEPCEAARAIVLEDA